MKKLLKKYLISTYSDAFFPIFLTLYTITSIIFLVKIASLTSVIQINFLELLELYSYSIPKILFYTFPISVFLAITIGLAKLSSEYELIVITSFGFKPSKVIGMIVPTLIISTLLMLIISLALIPKADYMKKKFLQDKQTEAQFNIKASEYGQEFGKWLIYVNEEENGLYKDVVLFQQNKKEDVFIVSKRATMNNEKIALNLSLEDGKVVKIEDSVNQVNFKKMVLNNKIKQSVNINTFNDLIEYWREIKKDKGLETDFVFYILVSFLPFISIMFIISIGYFNPRYDKNNSTVWGLVLATIFIVISQKLAKDMGINALVVLPLVWIVSSYFFYVYKVKKHY